MKGEKIFYISWKGEESGAFSSADIRQMLDTGKIGYLHLVRTKKSKWIPLKDANLNELTELEKSQSIDRANDVSNMILYVTAGLAFLSPWVLLASTVFAIRSFATGNKRDAFISLITAISVALCGVLFFELIYPTIVE